MDTVLLFALSVGLGLIAVLLPAAGLGLCYFVVSRIASHKERLDRLESEVESLKRRS